MRRVGRGEPTKVFPILFGAIAQLGERLLCKQEVVGSIPSGSTSRVPARPDIRVSASVFVSQVLVASGMRRMRVV
jgi:hypothetical protein